MRVQGLRSGTGSSDISAHSAFAEWHSRAITEANLGWNAEEKDCTSVESCGKAGTRLPNQVQREKRSLVALTIQGDEGDDMRRRCA